jgi:hypothetical protein
VRRRLLARRISKETARASLAFHSFAG